ncbi:MAG: hypothetical protein GF364_17565, partial [Candidatus Lokiarchaeota archaeon]|nr:hypothetical protein [Candidatus Lokiarchaeota archaeon]
MAVKKKSNRKGTKYIGKSISIILFIIPIVLIAQFGQPTFGAISYLNKKFTDDCVVTIDEFMDSDPDRLNEYIWKFDKLTDLYNLPKNLTGDGWDHYIHMNVQFTKSPWSVGIRNNTMFLDYCDPLDPDHELNQIDYWHNTGHGSVYSGYCGFGQAFRYACALREGNETALEESRKHLLHIVKGYDLLSAVMPNGKMARFVAPNTTKAKDYLSFYFGERWTGSHLYFPVNYSYNGKDYVFYCETGTSVDCFMVYNALGGIYALCN